MINNFDDGFMLGRFFVSLIIDDLFFGIGLRIGRDTDEKRNGYIYHITAHIGYFMLSIGIIGGDNE